MYGSGYVIEHCIDDIRRRKKAEAYEQYVADVVRLMGENVAAAAGVLTGWAGSDYRPSYIGTRWGEEQKPPAPEDPRPCEEIAADVFARAKITRQR